MKHTGNIETLFHQAVSAIDSGNITELENLILRHPELLKERLHNNSEGYFKDPYLLWFVAGNPIRTEKLPPNIVEITRLLVQAVKHESPETCQQQIDYALGLVASGYIPRICGVQTDMIDLLINAGASPGDGMVALANGNLDAAKHLIDRGAKITLASAVCLERSDDISHLSPLASDNEKLVALAAAAYYGKADMIKLLLETGTAPSGYPQKGSGFHSHATPLHQAVSSGSFYSVKLLAEAGASLSARDTVYSGTPLEWANYLQRDTSVDETKKSNFALIETYLHDREKTADATGQAT